LASRPAAGGVGAAVPAPRRPSGLAIQTTIRTWRECSWPSFARRRLPVRAK
jgi:hypothetical protein